VLVVVMFAMAKVPWLLLFGVLFGYVCFPCGIWSNRRRGLRWHREFCHIIKGNLVEKR